ncbi:MAG: scpB [Paenibacillaceae bacterium]|nr:scpB [Paenibacillaceae bacterium]
MNMKQLKSVIEGLLFVTGDEGLSAAQLAAVLEQRPEAVNDAVKEMREQWSRDGRGLQIVEVAGAYRLTTIAEHAPYIEKLATSPIRATLSQAALETLSIVAYKQPITRVEIEEIRGVKSDRALHTLVSRELIEEIGRAEAIGRPILYGTTRAFLDYFNLRSLDDLPEPSESNANDRLDDETVMLFSKLDRDEEQLSIDDVKAPDGEGNA